VKQEEGVGVAVAMEAVALVIAAVVQAGTIGTVVVIGAVTQEEGVGGLGGLGR